MYFPISSIAHSRFVKSNLLYIRRVPITIILRAYLYSSAYQVFVRPEMTIDFESFKSRLNLTSLPLLLTLDDGALASATQRVHLTVTDVNEAPRFQTDKLILTSNEGKVQQNEFYNCYCRKKG